MKEQDLKKIRKFKERKEQKKVLNASDGQEEKGLKRSHQVLRGGVMWQNQPNMTTHLFQQGKRGNKHSLGR